MDMRVSTIHVFEPIAEARRTRCKVSRPVWTMASASSTQGMRPEKDAEV